METMDMETGFIEEEFQDDEEGDSTQDDLGNSPWQQDNISLSHNLTSFLTDFTIDVYGGNPFTPEQLYKGIS